MKLVDLVSRIGRDIKALRDGKADVSALNEVKQSISEVQVDTSGLATTEALQHVQTELRTKADATALDKVERSIPAVVLREAPLVEGETIKSTRIEAVQKPDGSTVLVLVQTTSTGREVSATIPTIAPQASSVDAVTAYTWQDLDSATGLSSGGGWIERHGGLVTMHILRPQITGIKSARQLTARFPGATVAIPPFGETRDPIAVQMVYQDGTSSRLRTRVTEWEGSYYLQPVASEAPDPAVDELVLTWWTTDTGPVTIKAAA